METKRFTDPATAIQRLKQFGEFGGVNPSITDSATYTFLDEKTMIDAFNGDAAGCFLYSRHWNPSNKYLAEALAAMEGTESAWVTASGMAAITTSILQLVNSGDHIITSVTTYGGTYAFLANYLKKFNIEVTFVNISDLESIRKSVKENTKLIYTESMTNPMLQVSNIPELSKIAKSNGIKLVVDNTFTPMILSPFILGADIVVYSMTKFINGKNDAVAGAICASEDFINEISNVNDGTAMLLGPVLDPLRSSNILKNINTLHIRMQKHSENAKYLAHRFKEIGLKSNYPGLPEHPDHGLLTSMMNMDFGYGGMIAIDLETPERAAPFLEMMQERGVGYHAVSLGYFKTLFSNSGRSTSSEVPQVLQDEMGLSPGLIRFSVGLDHDIEATYKLIKSCLDDLGLV
ncbi:MULTISPECIES: aminotransferase class I/II-fold pyridoxal phosphate-dependent enzyme [unclassified Oceanispirochaeta]|uniref:aminotransferase class I/II-fold pyridoxal phosphate-dependent enzyme n=1 Tax=unclassified Oceanispirochaeta TaxID=2635722 RepID=UPI000E09CA2A|nr:MULTISPECIES: aminotransferase class I/II-fold pyridoxal phosphate-dependent enzyme [unclassified Oceanispirochaeta]MBF9018695.1 aminotransferase class I/II-fold pyridoxal phosphate-dependent enzyme [Oceanispirochaeta sp. M2]NPD75130.1 aminotransferase class I/II-fold pyridoxal phosphate-dependent enzyme [Oceanispirochaeta sp. M1]RDG29016.1 aminotransferase class I/II-fold pyridoxal phosphate-dependent enzyme [Oceanispirochaeta sp. M1]